MPTNYPVTDCLQTHLINEQLTQLFAHKCVGGLSVPRLLPVRLLSVLCKSAESNCDRPALMDCFCKKVIILTAHSQLTRSSICSRLGFLWLHVRSFYNVPNWWSTLTKLMQFFMRNRFISIPHHSSKLSTRRACVC